MSGWRGNGRIMRDYHSQESYNGTGRMGAGAVDQAIQQSNGNNGMELKKTAIAAGLGLFAVLVQGLIIGTSVYYGTRAARKKR